MNEKITKKYNNTLIPIYMDNPNLKTTKNNPLSKIYPNIKPQKKNFIKDFNKKILLKIKHFINKIRCKLANWIGGNRLHEDCYY